MTVFRASSPEIESHELVRFLLQESGQYSRDSVNPHDLLQLLKLRYFSFDFDLELPADAKQAVGGHRVRALLDFRGRIVATDENLKAKRTRFSVLHEIGHYVLPYHEHAFYICDEAGLSFNAQLKLEQQANEFAADLLFMADRFTLEVNSRSVTAATVKELANKYQASFEATARRMVIKHFKPCMLIVFKEKTSRAKIDSDRQSEWEIQYCIASPIFRSRFFQKLAGTLPLEWTQRLIQPGRDITDTITEQITIKSSSQGIEQPFQAQLFYNSYNVFCLLTPC